MSRCAAILVFVVAGPWTLSPAGQQKPFVERVEVARVLVDVRVLDDDWRPILDLAPADFAVRIGGKSVNVESAEWIGGGAPAVTPSPSAESATAARSTQPSGRLVIFLVQRDLEWSRIIGLMKMGQLVDELLAPLTSDDRVAVLSFDSRLRIWTDFTNDFDRVRSILSEDVILRRPGPVSQSNEVSMLAGLQKAGPQIFGIERALQHIAESVEPLRGAKSIVLLGYGFGRFDGHSGGVTLMDGWDEANAALQRARVSVFTLNVTQANYNSLQAGLQTVSAETGGIYASTYEFPRLAIRRVGQALAGHYVLFVEKPNLDRGVHPIQVKLTRTEGTVTARSTYVEE